MQTASFQDLADNCEKLADAKNYHIFYGGQDIRRYNNKPLADHLVPGCDEFYITYEADNQKNRLLSASKTALLQIINTGNSQTHFLRMQRESTVNDIIKECKSFAGTGNFVIAYGGCDIRRYEKSVLKEILMPESNQFYLLYPKKKPKVIPSLLKQGSDDTRSSSQSLPALLNTNTSTNTNKFENKSESFTPKIKYQNKTPRISIDNTFQQSRTVNVSNKKQENDNSTPTNKIQQSGAIHVSNSKQENGNSTPTNKKQPTTKPTRKYPKHEYRKRTIFVQEKKGRGILKKMAYKDYYIPVSDHTTWSIEFLEELYRQKQRFKKAGDETKIAADYDDLCKMFISAKQSDWDITLGILDKKPYLVNGIPQGRTWAVLHEAAYQNNARIVKQILEIHNCDRHVKSKRDWDKSDNSYGESPLQIAEKYLQEDVIQVLKDETAKRRNNNLPSMVNIEICNKFIIYGIPYFLTAIAFMKKEMVDFLDVENTASFTSLMKNIYHFMVNEWKYVQEITSHCFYFLDQRMYDDCLSGVNSRKMFFVQLLQMSLNSNTNSKIADGFERTIKNGKPTQDDTHMCLYATFLQSLLLYWEELTNYTGMTYKGVIIDKTRAKSIQQGIKFGWISLVSCSKSYDNAVSCFKQHTNIERDDDNDEDDDGQTNGLFIIDNTRENKWSPREVKKFILNVLDDNLDMEILNQHELVYPAGAEFSVTRVRHVSAHHDEMYAYVEVHLKQLAPFLKGNESF